MRGKGWCDDPSVLRQSNGNDFNVEIIAEHRGMDNGFACRNPAPFGKGAKCDSARLGIVRFLRVGASAVVQIKSRKY